MNPELYNLYISRGYNNCYMPNNCEAYNNTCYNTPNYPNYNTQNLQPISSQMSELHIYIQNKIMICINKHARNNMGMIPMAISKEEYKEMVNEIMVELSCEEEKLHKMLKSRSSDYLEDRSSCMFCGGMLKTVVEVILISSLMQNGCTHCRI